MFVPLNFLKLLPSVFAQVEGSLKVLHYLRLISEMRGEYLTIVFVVMRLVYSYQLVQVMLSTKILLQASSSEAQSAEELTKKGKKEKNTFCQSQLAQMLDILSWIIIKSMHFSKLLILVLVLQITQIDAQSPSHKSFLQWKQQHAKNYVDQTEQLYRFYIYSQNVNEINQHNSKADRAYEKGVNQFSDLTWEEIQITYLTALPPTPDQYDYSQDQAHNLKQDDSQEDKDDNPIVGACSINPDKILYDYRIKVDGVNPFPAPVRNQGSCGSCYGFASSTSMSYTASTRLGVNYEFNYQEFVSCDRGNGGCNGGWMGTSFEYAKKNKLARHADYPYVAKRTACNTSVAGTGAYLLKSYTRTKGCPALITRLSIGPTTVAVNANNAFMAYRSGIFSDPKCKTGQVNHAVTLVGVTQCGVWIVQNSWGTGWGEKGFIRMAADNTCFICDYGVHPLF